MLSNVTKKLLFHIIGARYKKAPLNPGRFLRPERPSYAFLRVDVTGRATRRPVSRARASTCRAIWFNRACAAIHCRSRADG